MLVCPVRFPLCQQHLVCYTCRKWALEVAAHLGRTVVIFPSSEGQFIRHTSPVSSGACCFLAVRGFEQTLPCVSVHCLVLFRETWGLKREETINPEVPISSMNRRRLDWSGAGKTSLLNSLEAEECLWQDLGRCCSWREGSVLIVVSQKGRWRLLAQVSLTCSHRHISLKSVRFTRGLHSGEANPAGTELQL